MSRGRGLDRRKKERESCVNGSDNDDDDGDDGDDDGDDEPRKKK